MSVETLVDSKHHILVYKFATITLNICMSIADEFPWLLNFWNNCCKLSCLFLTAVYSWKKTLFPLVVSHSCSCLWDCCLKLRALNISSRLTRRSPSLSNFWNSCDIVCMSSLGAMARMSCWNSSWLSIPDFEWYMLLCYLIYFDWSGKTIRLDSIYVGWWCLSGLSGFVGNCRCHPKNQTRRICERIPQHSP